MVKYKDILIVVSDIERSRRFYRVGGEIFMTDVMLFPDRIREIAKENPEKTSIIATDRTLSFGDWINFPTGWLFHCCPEMFVGPLDFCWIENPMYFRLKSELYVQELLTSL